ncbi:transmembrane protein, putative [Medicago truncatula]|uniref:Transmembrane protein, putative n=1 Tax=Medicago truncatula TaxID=3880 RepID=G7JJ32_MEDTR|nr:transmembrane protein, putative [Medicago truncatula]
MCEANMELIYLHFNLPRCSEIRANTCNQLVDDVRILVEHFLVLARRRWRVRVPLVTIFLIPVRRRWRVRRRRIVVVILGMAALVVPWTTINCRRT